MMQGYGSNREGNRKFADNPASVALWPLVSISDRQPLVLHQHKVHHCTHRL